MQMTAYHPADHRADGNELPIAASCKCLRVLNKLPETALLGRTDPFSKSSSCHHKILSIVAIRERSFETMSVKRL